MKYEWTSVICKSPVWRIQTFDESLSVRLEELRATGRLQVLWEGFRDSVLEFDSESVPDVPIRQQAALSQEMVDVFNEWSKARRCEAIRLASSGEDSRLVRVSRGQFG